MQSPAFASYPLLSVTATNPYDSNIATADTIQLMQQIVEEYAKHPLVIAATHSAISNIPLTKSSLKDVLRAIFYWIKARVHLDSDENIITHGLHQHIDQYGADLLITPDVLLSMPQPTGDCDDFSMLAATMLRVLGIESKFVTVAANPNEPQTFSHVYIVVYLPNGERMSLDCSHGVIPGWEYQRVTRRHEW